MKKSEITRNLILQKAFELIYTKGYQTTSIDEIIAQTQVTKGAFFYHFKNKDEMGIALVNEILSPEMLNKYDELFTKSKDPNDAIYKMTKHLLLEDPMLLVKYGCPVSNLTQEMTPWHPAFSAALQKLTQQWRKLLVKALKAGIQSGYYHKNMKPEQVCDFLISSYWGIRNLGKLNNDSACYKGYLKELKTYLEGLK